MIDIDVEYPRGVLLSRAPIPIPRWGVSAWVGEHTGVLVVVVGGTHEVDGQTDALCVTLSSNYVGISI